jgi:hypothetical protein
MASGHKKSSGAGLVLHTVSRYQKSDTRARRVQRLDDERLTLFKDL